MKPSEYIQILQEYNVLREKVYELSTLSPETYNILFNTISKDENGLPNPSDILEIFRVWITGVSYTFKEHSNYPEDIELLINQAPDNLPEFPELQQFINIKLVTSETKNYISKYLAIRLEKERLQKECDSLYQEYLKHNEWEEGIADYYKELETQEYREEFDLTQPDLLALVNELYYKYMEAHPCDFMIDGDKDYFFSRKSLPEYYIFDYGKNQLENNILKIEKLYTLDKDKVFFDSSTYETIPEVAGGVSFYKEIGHITIGKAIGDKPSMIYIKTDNADLLQLYKELVDGIKIHQNPLKTNSEKKQKGRYRLTNDEIKKRKKIVKEANRIYKESNPQKTWKEIAKELDIPERTLRDWRHNPTI